MEPGSIISHSTLNLKPKYHFDEDGAEEKAECV